MQEWLFDTGWMQIGVLVGVCWAAHWFGKRIRKVEVDGLVWKQMDRTTAQHQRIARLNAILGEES